MNIQSLRQKQLFVFGSNTKGEHIGGAAKLAHEKFGAEWGVGEGLTGQCYAFPTLNKDFKQVSDEELKRSIDVFYACANLNPSLEFLLTAVGTGIAGFPIEKMKALFADAPKNVTKCEEFV